MAVALAACGAIYWWRRRPPDPAAAERQRRARLNQIGRIAEGRVVEILDAPPLPVETRSALGLFRRRNAPLSGEPSNGGRKLVCYSYSISGVTYETSQDVTGLEERICLERVAAGQPASVKYDPAKPGNSILIAEDWSGLH